MQTCRTQFSQGRKPHTLLLIYQLFSLWVNIYVCAYTHKNAHKYVYTYTYRGGPKKLGIYLLKICIYSYMFKLQSSLKYSPCDAIHLSRCVLCSPKRFLNLLILMSISASAIFCFSSSTLAKHFPLRTFFTWGNKKQLLTARLCE